MPGGIVAAQLRGDFAKHDARQERNAGHVAADPELFGRQVFITDADVPDVVLVDDGGQLLHLVTLPIVSANRIEIGEDRLVVELGEIND